MAERKEVRIAGAGAHGVIDGGLILQEAAVIYDDMNAHHVQSYGPEARSDWARSEVIVSSGDIDYPKATHLDVLLVTTQDALDRYLPDLKPAGLLIADAELETPQAGPNVLRLPLLAEAEKLSKAGLIHIVALGALVQACQVVTRPAIETAVRDHFPQGGESAPMQALELGYRLGQGEAT